MKLLMSLASIAILYLLWRGSRQLAVWLVKHTQLGRAAPWVMGWGLWSWPHKCSPGPIPQQPMSPMLIELIVIVNGVDVVVTVDPHELLRAVRDRALLKTHNQGRPSVDWEIRDEAGKLLLPEMTIEQAQLQPRARLFVTLKAGSGG